jgi:hypothetical protein
MLLQRVLTAQLLTARQLVMQGALDELLKGHRLTVVQALVGQGRARGRRRRRRRRRGRRHGGWGVGMVEHRLLEMLQELELATTQAMLLAATRGWDRGETGSGTSMLVV